MIILKRENFLGEEEGTDEEKYIRDVICKYGNFDIELLIDILIECIIVISPKVREPEYLSKKQQWYCKHSKETKRPYIISSLLFPQLDPLILK